MTLSEEILELFPLTPVPVGKALGLKETYLDFKWITRPNSAVAIQYDELPAALLLANQDETLFRAPQGVFRHCLPAYLLLAVRSLVSRKEMLECGTALDGVLFLLFCESKHEESGEPTERLSYLSLDQLKLIRRIVFLYIESPMESYDTFDDEVVDGAIEFVEGRIEAIERMESQ